MSIGGQMRHSSVEYQQQWRAENLDGYEREKAKHREYYQKNRKKLIAQQGARYRKAKLAGTLPKKLPLAGKKYVLKAMYGITLDQYNGLLAQQNGVCKICHEPPKKGRQLSVDHCHNSNKIRGLLCSTCNSGLGHFKDDPELLKAAIEYLQ
jgi:hypothetical protein